MAIDDGRRTTTTAIDVRLTTLPPLGDLAETWRSLERVAEPSFFQSWHWIGCWLEESGLRPRLLIARRGQAVVGLGLVQAAAERRAGLPAADFISIRRAIRRSTA